MRLSKLMAERGLCSRREADRYIEMGEVKVDGAVVSVLGTRVWPHQKITLGPKAVHRQAGLATVVINKPPGYVSGLPEKGYPSAVMLVNRGNRQNKRNPVPNRKGLAPAGRLDIDSTGLIVFTQDGRIARQLVGDHYMEKEYLVRFEGKIGPGSLGLLRHGLSLDQKQLKPSDVVMLKDNLLRFTLTEGRKRQIRRMCALVGLQVTGLKRIRIGRVRLGNLKPGQWRLLGRNERF
ncbi:MAG: pseudouridine synthase [Gammaproteobacteria bacterium]|nr:pseudouridine synthase [Gammaproteobacteria bacterium]